MVTTAAVMLASLLAAEPAKAMGPVDELKGVYRQRFQNADVQGRSFWSENILEVVPYGSAAAYVRVHLEFFNGHSCKLFGIARVDGTRLVYEAPNGKGSGRRGRATISIENGKVVLGHTDDLVNADYCGARGGLSAEWPYKGRSAIRYMDLVLNSWEYKQAVAEFDQAGGVTGAATPIAKFIPSGWIVEEVVRGDLNGDGIADQVLVLVEKVQVTGSPMGGQARMLVVLIERRDGTLEQVGTNRSVLLCTQCFGALGGGPRLSFQDQQLVVEQERGSRTTVSGTWRFTFDAKVGRLRLARLDVLSRDRVEGTGEFESIDYLAGSCRKGARAYDAKTDQTPVNPTSCTVDPTPKYLEDVDDSGLQ